ncbi:MAG: TetR/AcrR family transcriptional regulator [Myxococcales bacterium]|nr:TetR/AcrR family transcriptional regulator [Myxococcales bacterium]MCB9629070.1 TetR/AcrR family transcriptional regulator [Sandaracinaceae bacterium]
MTTASKTRPRRERNREATQARILAAAEAEFALKGYDGARLRDVAARADVHHALLHHYFGDKVGLFRAVVQNAFAGVSTRALAALRSGTSIRALLETYVNMLIDFHVQNPNLVRLLHYSSLDTTSPAFEAMEEVTREISAPVMEAVGHAVEAAQRAKVIRSDIDARRLVSLSIGAVAYVFHEDRFFSLFHGGAVRAPASVEAHRTAALAFLNTAVFP